MKYNNLFYQANNRLNIRSEVKRLLPWGKVEGHEYIALNSTRNDSKLGSFKINLLSGKWSDFATGDKGSDIVSLYAYLQGVNQYKAALKLCDEVVSFGSRNFSTYTSNHSVKNKDSYNHYIKRVWQDCLNISGSVVETYLKNRGIIGNIPRTIFYHPNLYHLPTKTYHPAMVAEVSTWSGKEPVGIHRTYLKRDGSNKADIQPNKMMLGQSKGGAVMLGSLGQKLVITEGIETALSIYISTSLTVWATLSTSGMIGITLPPPHIVREIIIAADNDEAGKQAAVKTAKRLTSEGYCVSIAIPPAGQDFNDLLRGCNGKA